MESMRGLRQREGENLLKFTYLEGGRDRAYFRACLTSESEPLPNTLVFGCFSHHMRRLGCPKIRDVGSAELEVYKLLLGWVVQRAFAPQHQFPWASPTAQC